MKIDVRSPQRINWTILFIEPNINFLFVPGVWNIIYNSRAGELYQVIISPTIYQKCSTRNGSGDSWCLIILIQEGSFNTSNMRSCIVVLKCRLKIFGTFGTYWIYFYYHISNVFTCIERIRQVWYYLIYYMI